MWQRLPLFVLFISPSSLSACHRGYFLSLVATVGLIIVVGLLIDVVAWRGGDWHGGAIEVEIGEVGLGGFRWGWPVSRFVEIGMERVNKIVASGYFTTSSEMKALVEVATRREVKIRERREMGENRYDFGKYYFIV